MNQIMELKKDIVSFKRIAVVLGGHPHSEWISLQLAMHEEFACHQSALKGIRDVGGCADAQVQGDDQGVCLEAWMRVCSALRPLTAKAQQFKVDMSTRAADMEVPEAEAKTLSAVLEASCAEKYIEVLSVKHDFMAAW